MFALKNELYPGQTVSYAGRAYVLLLVDRGMAWLAGLSAPVPAFKLAQLG